ncbi:SAC3 family protein B isoform X2 [Magnolia sinica]|uniref:SAC3 family protein B isoform X2 n=1 Tax=Magnolia sinica TaxID=86752 RepID=UPI002657ADE7|nr:SAC3 family protein B isoform X2 [Magnolia sinica]
MAFQGFGKSSGPSVRPKSQTLFGNPPKSPSPTNPYSNPTAPLQQFPRPAVAPRTRDIWPNSPPLNGADSLAHTWRTPVATFVDARNTRVRFPTKSANLQGPKSISPLLLPPAEASFGNPRFSQVDTERPAVSPPRWGNQPKSPINVANSSVYRRSLTTVAPHVDVHDAEPNFLTKPASFQASKRSRSPSFPSTGEGTSGNFHSAQDDTGRLGTHTGLLFNNGASKAPRRTLSPPLAFESNRPVKGHRYPLEEAQRPAISPPRWGNQPMSPANANSQTPLSSSPVAPYVDAHDAGSKFPTKPNNFQVPKRTRLPPISSTDEVILRKSHFVQDELSSSPVAPYIDAHNAGPKFAPDAGPKFAHDAGPKFAHDAGPKFPAKPNDFQVPKRTRSPPISSTDEVILRKSNFVQDDSESETQAKAKRLARFNVELSQPVQGPHDLTRQKLSGIKNDQAMEKQKFTVKNPVQEVDLSNDSILFDNEGIESSSVVVGLCPDMCPESEREERERKGDLDKYERVDGDRNQTSKYLAVKKYNRTAEREVGLIRPMPVLQKTVDYLLCLLDQPYDDKFLRMYNFLWDRMRAIRMDLRMQHIFNRNAITMLEQMIRLHIIAMHELCEYTKGEGFSEGFDAHLNIEQMNKASVELFQLYDDHRKNGSSVPTEKEFRGYYALLKLDKHPGYKVEPAELSLDLAKMTPDIRCTPEILFTRDVARACRTGNFIAFFRLARKATYLQACLMHAHFSKLRTQALASLHSGLQNKQGIPIKQVINWLGMEEEDIESLLEYHGFSIDHYRDVYMVKRGPFLNSDMDYPTKCSQLVHLKKSERIIDDVSSGPALSSPRERRKILLDMVDDFARKEASSSLSEPETWVDAIDEDMPDFEDNSFSQDNHQVQLFLETPTGQDAENNAEVAELHFLPSESLDCYPPHVVVDTVSDSAADVLVGSSTNKNLHYPHKAMLPQTATGRPLQFETSMVEKTVPQEVMTRDQGNESMMLCQRDEAAAAAKLKLMLRIWKRRSLKLREIREQRQLEATAALNSLSLGVPILKDEVQRIHATELNIDRVVRERLDRHVKSWSRMNVSEVVVQILGERNPDAKCLCWKLIVCSQTNDSGGHKSMQKNQTNNVAGTWLLSKLMGIRSEDDDELAVCSSGLSIWKKWVLSPQICCLSVIRHVAFDGNRPVAADDVVTGAGAVLFLVSESLPWDLQRTRLHNLLSSLPPLSGLPLLILTSGVHEDEVSDPSLTIVNRLSLNDVDKRRISTISIVFLVGNQAPQNQNGFLSDNYLRESLQWLANQSPVQPVLRKVKTRDLVLGYLGSSLEVLDNMKISEVGPDHCIWAFNDALDRSSEDIATAGDMNPAHWPSPEIDLLDEFSDERRATNSSLPNISWSSSARIKSTISTIKCCKLPCFATDLSWLNQGSDMGKEIPNQKLALEKCLTRYLTEASKMMGEELAAREAYVMLQKGAGLKVDGLRYQIIPRWAVIFRRVFNWRLMNLIRRPFSEAYVLEHSSRPSAKPSNPSNIFTPLKRGGSESDLSADMWPVHHVSTELSLDEMVEVSCRHPFGRPISVSLVSQSPKGTVNKGGEVSETIHDSPEDVEIGNDSLFNKRRTSSAVVLKTKEGDKLSMLLEQCKMLQDKIDDKLTIYF